jgi:hypothetical protein
MQDKTEEVQEIIRLWSMWLDAKTLPDTGLLASWASKYELKLLEEVIQRTSRKQRNMGGTMNANSLRNYVASVARNRKAEGLKLVPDAWHAGVPKEWLHDAVSGE